MDSEYYPVDIHFNARHIETHPIFHLHLRCFECMLDLLSLLVRSSRVLRPISAAQLLPVRWQVFYPIQLYRPFVPHS